MKTAQSGAIRAAGAADYKTSETASGRFGGFYMPPLQEMFLVKVKIFPPDKSPESAVFNGSPFRQQAVDGYSSAVGDRTKHRRADAWTVAQIQSPA